MGLHAVSIVSLLNNNSALAEGLERHVSAQLQVHVRRQGLEEGESEGQALQHVDVLGRPGVGMLHEHMLHQRSLCVGCVQVHANFFTCCGVR